jgi:hypothetical protein
MRRAIITIGLVVMFFWGSANAIESKNFYSDGNIMPNEQWNAVSIYDTPPAHTTVNMTGGNVSSMHTYDAIILNMTNGRIEQLYANEFSTVNVSGGFPGYGSMYAGEHSTINFSGTAEVLNAHALNDSRINITGGTIRWLDAGNEGTINIYGGDITEVWTHENAFINIFGHHDLMKISSGGMNGFGFVQGYYNDLSWFRFDFSSAETYSHINLIPEPATILLLVVGGLFLRKKD